MRDVVLYIAMSLDGYIADPAGGVGWLSGDGSSPDDPGSYPSFYETVDTILLGFGTYRQIAYELSPKQWIYHGKTCYVLTHQRRPPAEEIIFTDRDPAELIRALRAVGEKDIWICGGADVVNQLLDHDLIDRYCVSVIPTLLGGGIPLFGPHGFELPLKLVSTRQYNGIVDLVYVRRPERCE